MARCSVYGCGIETRLGTSPNVPHYYQLTQYFIYLPFSDMSSFRMTPAAVQSGLNVSSPEGLSTLSLRSRRILYIENLEFTSDAFSAIDLTDNEIAEFGGIPKCVNLEILLLANNNISKVGQIGESSVKSLSLMNNSLSSFHEVVKLRVLRNLQFLILTGNPVTDEHNYRLFVVWLIPNLKVLDCQKVKLKERAEAKELFGASYETRYPAADAMLSGNKASVPVSKETRLMETTMKKLSAEDKATLVKELEKATSMEEIERISKALQLGYVG